MLIKRESLWLEGFWLGLMSFAEFSQLIKISFWRNMLGRLHSMHCLRERSLLRPDCLTVWRRYMWWKSAECLFIVVPVLEVKSDWNSCSFFYELKKRLFKLRKHKKKKKKKGNLICFYIEQVLWSSVNLKCSFTTKKTFKMLVHWLINAAVEHF